jgi:luciferase family oxidoreductase group 1
VVRASDQGAVCASHFGAASCFDHFITERMGPEIMQAYRDAFRPSALNAKPRGSVGVFVLCADTEAEAERLAASRDLWRLRLDYGAITPIPSVEEALAYPYSDAERARIAHNRRRQIVGTPEQVRLKLLELAQRYGVDEFVVVSICHEFAARKRSYALLAEAFALAPAAMEAG